MKNLPRPTHSLATPIILVVALVLRMLFVPLHLSFGEHVHEALGHHVHSQAHGEQHHGEHGHGEHGHGHHDDRDHERPDHDDQGHSVEDHADQVLLAREGSSHSALDHYLPLWGAVLVPGPEAASLGLVECVARPPDVHRGCRSGPRAPPVTA